MHRSVENFSVMEVLDKDKKEGRRIGGPNLRLSKG